MSVSPSGGLYTLNVPNPISTGFDAPSSFDVAAVSITDHVGGTQTFQYQTPSIRALLEPDSRPPNDYTFYGQAGDLMNFQSCPPPDRYEGNSIDSVVRVYDPSGNLVALNDDGFESSDSSIIDLLLTQTGRLHRRGQLVPRDPRPDILPRSERPELQSAAYYGAGRAITSCSSIVSRLQLDRRQRSDDNEHVHSREGAYTVDGGAGTNTIQATAGLASGSPAPSSSLPPTRAA